MASSSSTACIPFVVKWNKQVLEFTLDTTPGGALLDSNRLKRELEERTGVPIERQKLMAKSKHLWKGVLKDDVDFMPYIVASTTAGGGAWQLLLMGSSATVEQAATTTNNNKTIFIEDLPPEERAKHEPEPSGLHNLGNTCYLNSVVQCLRAVPSLRSALQSYDPSRSSTTTSTNNNSVNPRLSSLLVLSLRDTMSQLDRTVDAVAPHALVRATKLNVPQFDQIDPRSRQPRQQDAEEFYSQLLMILAQELQQQPLQQPPTNTTSTSNILMSAQDLRQQAGIDNVIDAIFGIQLEETLVCDEVPPVPDDDNNSGGGEPMVVSTDLQRKLVCSIQGGSDQLATVNINHISEGIVLSLNGKVEKHSQVLQRNAMWTRKDRISRLPMILVVQFGRFFWKATPDSQDHAGVKCKIMKPIVFHSTLDVYEFCSKSIQSQLDVSRKYALQQQELELATKQQQSSTMNMDETTTTATVVKEGEETTTTNVAMDVDDDDEEAAALQAALAMSLEQQPCTTAAADATTGVVVVPPIGPGLPPNFQGIYELFAVTTHKGRDADGGHYMSWVKSSSGGTTTKSNRSKIADTNDDNEDWFVFDDDEVSPCKTEDILKLKGGGDWHMSYLNFYRPKK